MLDTNDAIRAHAMEAVEENFLRLVELIANETRAKIVVGFPPRLQGPGADSCNVSLGTTMAECNAALDAISNLISAAVAASPTLHRGLDWTTLYLPYPSPFWFDSVHPAYGHALAKPLVDETIRIAVPEPSTAPCTAASVIILAALRQHRRSKPRWHSGSHSGLGQF